MSYKYKFSSNSNLNYLALESNTNSDISNIISILKKDYSNNNIILENLNLLENLIILENFKKGLKKYIYNK